MTQQEAQSLLVLMQIVRPDIPPKFFDAMMNNPICRVLEMVAAGSVEVKVSPVAAAAPAAEPPKADAAQAETPKAEGQE